MPHVSLSDIIVPEVYNDYQAVNSPERTAFYESGVVTRNAELDQKADTGGNTLNLPFWKDLDADKEPNQSDTSSDEASPHKLEAGEMLARIAYLNQGYSSADLSAELAGSDPMQRIAERFGKYWTRQWQRRIIASALGVLSDNTENDDGDMVHEADGSFSQKRFIEAAFTLGDRFDAVQAIAVHSLVYQKMVENDEVETIRDSQGNLLFETYMGRRIVVDDGMPAESDGDSNDILCTSILFADGAFGYGNGQPRVPVEVQREAAKGHGGGMETLWERKTMILHPFGFSFDAKLKGDESPDLSKLEDKGSWKRVVERKNVPMAFLVTKE